MSEAISLSLLLKQRSSTAIEKNNTTVPLSFLKNKHKNTSLLSPSKTPTTSSTREQNQKCLLIVNRLRNKKPLQNLQIRRKYAHTSNQQITHILKPLPIPLKKEKVQTHTIVK